MIMPEPSTAAHAAGSAQPEATLALRPLPAEGPAFVEADENAANTAIGSDKQFAESTASLSSSIFRYRTLHGRTYHSERDGVEYWGSNDERANFTMDLVHHMFTLSLDGRLCLAPINFDDVKKVLDIGCGTGTWAIDFGDAAQPDCEVIGTDISPIQPSWVPANVKFEIDDCTKPWTFKENSVDYVHMRYLVGSISDWTTLFREAYKALAPGGWLESFEASAVMKSDDGTVEEGSAIARWGWFFNEGGAKIGRSFTVVQDGTQRKAMEEAGFVDIQEWSFKCPVGRWPKDPKLKEIGEYAHAALDNDFEGFVFFMANFLGWSREEITVYIAQLRKELRAGYSHPYYDQKIVWGRKLE